ncbi:MAG: TIM barrel protein [Clostridia bacterium]|nr:TIM barrel protein [Clostridia bacterium]
MKFSICIDMMFASLPFGGRIDKAAEMGADAIEFWGWREKDIDAIAERAKRRGLDICLCNLDSADPALSADLMRGILTHGRSEDLAKAIHESGSVMRRLGCKNAILLAGDNDPDISPERALENSFKALSLGVKAAEEEDINLLLEPLNTYDRSTYALPYSAPAFELVRAVASKNLGILLDLYHTQRMEGNLISTLTENIDKIGHFHVAGSPWRCEPTLGEVDYKQVFDAIENTGYKGHIGFEYRQKSEDFDLKKYIESIRGI